MVIIIRIAATVPPLLAFHPENLVLRRASRTRIIVASMSSAAEIESVGPGLWIWRAYDPAVKAELFSSAIAIRGALYLIDPIPLEPEAVAALTKLESIAGIIITNENHKRAADRFADRFQVSIYERGFTAQGLVAVAIDGAPAGEVAVYCEADDGTLIVGDALINFEPYGFALLPEKYCSDRKRMGESLSNLLDYSFERLLFAHGTPILSGARRRLEQLLFDR